eukprot:2438048-Alexandrium_andersonii.AAC.1
MQGSSRRRSGGPSGRPSATRPAALPTMRGSRRIAGPGWSPPSRGRCWALGGRACGPAPPPRWACAWSPVMAASIFVVAE